MLKVLVFVKLASVIAAVVAAPELYILIEVPVAAPTGAVIPAILE